MSSLIAELEARKMVQDQVADLAAHLATSPRRMYIGIDPTAPSMHVGHLVTFLLLRHAQAAGHQGVVLLGGGTSLAGDPSFKARERMLMTREEVLYNQSCLSAQLQQLLASQGERACLILNNYDWLHKYTFIDFIRSVGKHISVGYLMAKESMKRRLVSGLSYTEFAYPLLQAYDFYHLYHHHGVSVQMGGSDQWGNITTGIELLRKKSGHQAYGLTTPLLTKADGGKFGKTEQGSVWLDPKRTSPYAFFQFWRNVGDQEAPQLLRRLTLRPLPEIEALEASHAQAPHQRLLQCTLAQEMTELVHGSQAYQEVTQASRLLFEKEGQEALNSLSEATLLDLLAQVPTFTLPTPLPCTSPTLLMLLTTLTGGRICPSKRLARELIQAGAIRLNKQVITRPEAPLPTEWLFGRYLLLQKGKKSYYLIIREA